MYRKVIETRDAILILGEYVAPGALEQARGQVTGHGVPEQRATAAALARVLKEARQAKLDGATGQPGEAAALELPAAIHTSQEGGDLADEARFLVDVAQAYAAPATTRK